MFGKFLETKNGYKRTPHDEKRARRLKRVNLARFAHFANQKSQNLITRSFRIFDIFILVTVLIGSVICLCLGTGETLAFHIPNIELIHRIECTNLNCTVVVIIFPTRERDLQKYGVVSDLCKHHLHTFGICPSEASRIMKAFFVRVCDKNSISAVARVEQGFAFASSENRFLLRYKLLRRSIEEKIIAFIPSCSAVSIMTSCSISWIYLSLGYMGVKSVQTLRRLSANFTKLKPLP